jgi:hypothetical protein
MPPGKRLQDPFRHAQITGLAQSSQVRWCDLQVSHQGSFPIGILPMAIGAEYLEVRLPIPDRRLLRWGREELAASDEPQKQRDIRQGFYLHFNLPFRWESLAYLFPDHP